MVAFIVANYTHNFSSTANFRVWSKISVMQMYTTDVTIEPSDKKEAMRASDRGS